MSKRRDALARMTPGQLAETGQQLFDGKLQAWVYLPSPGIDDWFEYRDHSRSRARKGVFKVADPAGIGEALIQGWTGFCPWMLDENGREFHLVLDEERRDEYGNVIDFVMGPNGEPESKPVGLGQVAVEKVEVEKAPGMDPRLVRLMQGKRPFTRVTLAWVWARLDAGEDVSVDAAWDVCRDHPEIEASVDEDGKGRLHYMNSKGDRTEMDWRGFGRMFNGVVRDVKRKR